MPKRLPPEECEDCGGLGYIEETDDDGDLVRVTCHCWGQ